MKPSDGHALDEIYAFVWFGIVNGKKKDAEGTYIIGYIARSLKAHECHFGDFTLKHAIHVIKEDSEKSGREPIIGTRIDPRNQASQKLFARNGFQDTGIDDEAPEYHRWVRIGF
ncbi:hypothetical protein [Bifidobacterium aquikefiricola]|uniref:N-acetyltransferase domain-containing protein n=1 Tax=Bifidobacterium aquikefiricola TaxID=3059038 RepID=A0AB39U4P2_9BIFI